MLQAFTSGAQPVTTISAGSASQHSLFLKSNGSLWAMGDDSYGQLGDGTYYYSANWPEQIVASNVTAIAAGGEHSLFLKSNGSLWAMGWNTFGQLGDGTFNNANRPEQIVVASNVTAIAAGGEHSLFLRNDGSLWGMGENTYGQLGDGTTINRNTPEQIVSNNVTAIAAGFQHSLFLKSDGSLWAMGLNSNGQLGDGTYGGVLGYTNLPEMIVSSNVTAITAGWSHSLFIKKDGSLWAMGWNPFGQLGDGTYGSPPNFATNRPEQIVGSNVTAIAAGEQHSLFLKGDGSLWAMGTGSALGDGIGNRANSTEQIVTGGVMAITAGLVHSLFLKSDGSLWGMGDNNYGQLGDGTYNWTSQPEQILAPYNQITGQLMGGNNMQLSFVGVALKNYALDRSSSLSPPNWIPQATNAASPFGALMFTNTPDATTNNYWRIRSVP